jgi:hypothetical protein
MNKNLELYLGLGIAGAIVYFVYKKSNENNKTTLATPTPTPPVSGLPGIVPTEPVTLPAPVSNFANYASSNASSFFSSEKVKLNY